MNDRGMNKNDRGKGDTELKGESCVLNGRLVYFLVKSGKRRASTGIAKSIKRRKSREGRGMD